MKHEEEVLKEVLGDQDMPAAAHQNNVPRIVDDIDDDIVPPPRTTPLHHIVTPDAAANLAQVSGADGKEVLTRVIIPSVLALLSTILSYTATNLYFADAAAGGQPVNQALAQIDSDMYDIEY